ncbi:hypothetical protein L596_019626 [Steinernema carpocapsae]|uniref:Uncharacterized protein n=1 Tax=Steinernema carpocapsae TaxID=34508 RepID=A0A4U5MR28_STECR|nr:hypothetical protein L596_019626 [Steinernema carpocapsae]
MIPWPNLVILILYAASFALIGTARFSALKGRRRFRRQRRRPSTPSSNTFRRGEAKRSEEILRRKGVAEHRYDYKTFNKENFPESDFHKLI